MTGEERRCCLGPIYRGDRAFKRSHGGPARGELSKARCALGRSRVRQGGLPFDFLA